MLTADISSRCCTRDETSLETLLASGKFPGEIYRATCTGKCRGLLARFVAKIFATRLFQCFHVAKRVSVCDIGANATSDAHALRPHMHRAHADAYTSYSMTMESSFSYSAGFISIVFQTNKRKRSHLLPLLCQDSKSSL